MIKRVLNKIFKTPSPNTYGISETSKCKSRLAPFCIGFGLDLGYGGDPINESAIRVDLDSPYANVGKYPLQLAGDTQHLNWFKDNVIDYVYSSHLLEDFENVELVLKEWLRVLKPGGRLILYCPDEKIYRAHCKTTGQPYNTAHKHEDFSLEYVKEKLANLNNTKTIHEAPLVDVYSWELVCEKI